MGRLSSILRSAEQFFIEAAGATARTRSLAERVHSCAKESCVSLFKNYGAGERELFFIKHAYDSFGFGRFGLAYKRLQEAAKSMVDRGEQSEAVIKKLLHPLMAIFAAKLSREEKRQLASRHLDSITGVGNRAREEKAVSGNGTVVPKRGPSRAQGLRLVVNRSQ